MKLSKFDSSLALKKNPFFTPKNKKLKPRRKVIPSWRYSVNTMD
jgi:hypothetical protein